MSTIKEELERLRNLHRDIEKYYEQMNKKEGWLRDYHWGYLAATKNIRINLDQLIRRIKCPR